MIHIVVDIAPMGAVRMTQRGKFVKTGAQRYLRYKETIGYTAKTTVKKPLEGPLIVSMIFYYPVPVSWRPNKQADALAGRLRPTVKPDLDNVIKGVFDSLNGIVWKDDKQVVSEASTKLYGAFPRIEIMVEVLA